MSAYLSAPLPIWQKGEIWLETNIIVVLDYTEQKLLFGLFKNTRLIIACRTEMTRSTPLNGLINCLITASLGVAVLRRWVTISSFCQIYWTMPNLYLSKTAIEYSTTEIFPMLSYLICNYTLHHIRKTSNSWFNSLSHPLPPSSPDIFTSSELWEGSSRQIGCAPPPHASLE